MTPEEFENLKPGDMIDFSKLSWACIPPKTEGGITLNSTIAMVLATGSDRSILVEVPTGNRITEEFIGRFFIDRSLLNKFGWWFDADQVSLVEKTTELKPVGGNCTICNEFNQWQSGAYECWKHSH
ncbi:hypothetical protein UFOVP1290_247 [uncultured Caudovirales phage]|uniref:Uncharacterized protein n=1 Tax=uncultured Caudovirales phage TaxID=2100421 RepID=A0A6J5RR12_9CAUD|nr:hypothetical protein UFOVP1290_247 [uncultured Caudovirales phage]